MTTLLLNHPVCLEHVTPPGHPERVARLEVISDVLADRAFDGLAREEAPLADAELIARVHGAEHVAMVQAAAPCKGKPVYLDPDTVLAPGSWEASLRACGAVVRGVEAVMEGDAGNAFCAIRPPGHHAEPGRPMGFCVFNSVAVAAQHAREKYGIERVAVIDFDVHHGNGTQAIFWDDPNLMYGSTHQYPFYPGTGATGETGIANNIVNCPLNDGAGSVVFREAVSSKLIPAITAFKPELIILSAGFDAHEADPLGGLRLAEEDYRWVTLQMLDLADKLCSGRLVSALEGGYDLRALAASVKVHVETLMSG